MVYLGTPGTLHLNFAPLQKPLLPRPLSSSYVWCSFQWKEIGRSGRRGATALVAREKAGSNARDSAGFQTGQRTADDCGASVTAGRWKFVNENHAKKVSGKIAWWRKTTNGELKIAVTVWLTKQKQFSKYSERLQSLPRELVMVLITVLFSPQDIMAMKDGFHVSELMRERAQYQWSKTCSSGPTSWCESETRLARRYVGRSR